MWEFLESIEWYSLVQTLVAFCAVLVAHSALSTWKHEAKTKKQTDFLDLLTDSVHEYMQSLSKSVGFLKIIYIQFDSHRSTNSSSENFDHIVAYIKSEGRNDSKQLLEYLKEPGKIKAKIESLVARGQVYGFKNYRSCQDSIKMLLLQHQRLEVVAGMIRSPSLNWEHPDVLKSIEIMLTIKPDDIEKNFEEHNVAFLRFVQENYKQAFSGT